MIDLDVLDKQCPKCSGLGRTANPAWFPLWATRSDLKDSFQTLKSKEILNIVDKTTLEELDEPVFYVCKECNGKGKILTDKGKGLLEYLVS
ncbi:MAG: hypothetical protein APF81_06655 [Desulfosporosinus sp. BRH_c37]|nr:MAG: hypothetical protein APF81_06655 [Desulfosporosinus sp. BRH_c37]